MKDEVHKDWTEILPEIEFMLNSTIQATTGISPAEIIFGRKLRHWWKNTGGKGHVEKEMNKSTTQTKRVFRIGDKVLIKKENVTKDEDRYMGPATIKNRRHERSYEIQLDDGRILIRNVEWLKPFKSRGM